MVRERQSLRVFNDIRDNYKKLVVDSEILAIIHTIKVVTRSGLSKIKRRQNECSRNV